MPRLIITSPRPRFIMLIARRGLTATGENDVNPSHTGTGFDREMYLEVLRENLPLKRYVSRGDTRDTVDIAGPHEEADRAVSRVVRLTKSDHMPRFQPVLGSAGMGKTHLFWVLKGHESDERLGPYSTVYVPSPPAPVRVPLHFHACLVDELGDDLFAKASAMLVERFGKAASSAEPDRAAIMQQALNDYPGISSDAVKVLLHYHFDETKRVLARRWLLGDALSQAELEQLDIRTILEEDDVTLATFKILTQGSDRPIVLFVDEMEGPFNTHGQEGEKQYLEVLKKLYNECKNLVIVASCLTDIWPRILQMADTPMRSRMEQPVALRAFSRDDVKGFVERTMSVYWEEQNMELPPDPLFPVSQKDIDEAFHRSKGIPRETIRHLINGLDTVLVGKQVTAVEPQDDHVIKLTSSVVIGAVVKAMLIAGIRSGVDVKLRTASGGGAKQASAVVSLTKKGTTKGVCVDVPSVKDWNRSGGVAAFYSAQRVKNSIDEGIVDIGIIALPESTKGAKFESVSQTLGRKLFVIRLNEDSATELVFSTNRAKMEERFRGVFLDVIGSLFGP